MTGEIDRDWYCQHWEKPKEQCKEYEEYGGETCHADGKRHCYFCRSKHPTPEQFGGEYDSEVPDDMPVWVFHGDAWGLLEYWRYKQILDDLGQIDKAFGVISDNAVPVIVACTPWRKPDDKWRPS